MPPDVSKIVQQLHDWSRDFMAGKSRSEFADQRPNVDDFKNILNKEFPKINNFLPYTENSFYTGRKYDNKYFPFKKKVEDFKHGWESKNPDEAYFGDKFNYLDKFVFKDNISLNNYNDKYTFDNKINKNFKFPWSTFNKRSFYSSNPNDLFSHREFLNDNLYSKDITLDDHSYNKAVHGNQNHLNLKNIQNSNLLKTNNKNLNISNVFKNNKRIEGAINPKVSLSEKSLKNKDQSNNSFAKIFWNSKFYNRHDQPAKYLNRNKRNLNDDKINDSSNYMKTEDGQLLQGKGVAHLRVVNSRPQLLHRRRPGPRQHSHFKPKNKPQLAKLGQLLQPKKMDQNIFAGSIMSWPKVENIRINQTIQEHNYHKKRFKPKSKVNKKKFNGKRNVLCAEDLSEKITKIKGKLKQNLLNDTNNIKNNMSTNERASGRKLAEGKHLRFSRAFFTLEKRGNHGNLFKKHRSSPRHLNDYPNPHLNPPPSPPINLKDTPGHDEPYTPVEGDTRRYPPPEGDSSSSPVGGNTYHGAGATSRRKIS